MAKASYVKPESKEKDSVQFQTKPRFTNIIGYASRWSTIPYLPINIELSQVSLASTPVKQADEAPDQPGGGMQVTTGTGGTVVRFEPSSKQKGIVALSKTGLKVASMSDFEDVGFAAMVQADPDVLYVERFGIAIVRPGANQALPRLRSRESVVSTRPERIYHILGAASQKRAVSGLSRDYLLGYKTGMAATIDHILAQTDSQTALSSSVSFDESVATWGIQAINAAASHYSGVGVRLAVLDTGFDLNHADFAGRSIVSKSFIVGQDVQDGHGHGTHTAGTACGPQKPASQPRYGVAYSADMVIGKALSDSGYGTDSSIIPAMSWALDQKSDIISMSLGTSVGIGEAVIDDYEHIAQVCLDAGCVVIAAAGNESRRPGYIAPVGSPANCPSVTAVGAIDSSFAMYVFSDGSVNTGQSIAVVGPGVNVLSAWTGGGYARLDGTSMATPHVAGVAALFAEGDPQNRGRVLLNLISQHIRALPLPATDVGMGLVQAP